MARPRKRVKNEQPQIGKMVSVPEPESKAYLTNLSPEILQCIIDYVCETPVSLLLTTDFPSSWTGAKAG